MAGEEEDYGSARITIDLDDTSAVADAQELGQRIQNALERATRNIGQQIRRNIQRGLTAAISVRVEPDTARFQAQLQRALRGLSATVDVSPNATRLQVRVQRALRGLVATVDLAPDATRLQARIQQALRGLVATVDVSPDLAEFQTRVTQALRGLVATVDLAPDVTRFETRLQRALRRLSATVDVSPDTTRFQARLNRALRGLVAQVRVEPDTTRLAAQLRRDLRALGAVTVPAQADAARFRALLERALRRLPPISIRVDPDLTRLNAALRTHHAPPVRIPIDVDRDQLQRTLTGLSGLAGKVGGVLVKALKFGAFAIAAAGAATAVGKFVAALAPAAGLLAAVPAAVIGFQAALGALKLATLGVGDAFQSALTDDADDFAASLDALSPKAQAAAREVRALKPAFEQLRNSVQDAFFTQFQGQITATAKALNGPLKTGLAQIARGWGSAARGVLGYIQGSQGVANVRTILTATGSAVTGLAQTTNKLTAGLLQVASVVAEQFGPELGGGIANLGQKFGDWLQTIAQGGQAVSWVDGAVNTLARLGDIAGNVKGIFSGLFAASDGAGAGVLNNLQTVTKAVSDLVNSAQGQTALGNIFTTVGQVAQQLGPIISALVGNVGKIAPALAPIVTGLGPVLVELINQLGTAVQGGLPQLAVVFQDIGTAVIALAPALPPLAVAAASLVRSAADLLVPLAPVVALLAQLVGPVVSLAAPLIVTGVAVFGLVKAVNAAVAIFQLVRGAWIALNLAFAASPIGAIIVGVVALVAAIYLLYQRFAIVRTVVDAVGRALRDAFLATVSAVKSAASGIGHFFVSAFETAKSAVSTGIDAVVGFFTGLPGKITSGLSSLGSSIGQFFVDAFETAKSGLTTAVQSVIDFFVALPGQIVAGLKALPGLLVQAFTSAVALLIIVALTEIAALVFIFTELPVRIYNGLVSLGQFLLSAFVAGFNAVTSTVSGWISSTAAFFQALPGRILSALSSLGSFLLNAFRSGFNSVTSTVSGWISATVSFFRGLPGKIVSALSSLGSFLLRNFTSAFNSARSGITGFISTAVSFFRGLPGKIVSALSALPGKIANAFSSATNRVRSAVSGLISGVVSLFSGLPGKILGAIGNIGAQIMSKVKAGIPSSVRKYLPFAKGGIVLGPTHALIGEAGPEVVIPLTDPRRAVQLAHQSGLVGILAGQARTLAASATAATSSSGAAVSGSLSTLRSLLAGIGSLLDNVGADVVQGMVDGIRTNAGLVAAAAADMADGATGAARNALETHSPSKVFARIGTDVGRGFIDGLTGTAAKIKATTDKLAKDIISAFSGKKTRLDDRLVALVDAGNKRLQSLAAQRDSLAQRIADAQKFATDTANQALQSFSLQNLAQSLQDGAALTTRSLTAGLQGAVDQVKKFSSQLATLQRRGLGKDLLEQIVGLGPQQGAQLATALSTANRDQIKRINSLQSQLATASTKLGDTSADVLFDAGQQAGRGFLTGLQAQRKNIEKLMLDIAKGMQTAIRTALKIHSPSLVMRRLGDHTGAGLELGLVDRIAGIMRASSAAARAVVDAVSSQFDLLPGRMPSSLGTVGGNVVPLTRAQRARQDAPGAGAASGGTGGSVVHNHHWEIREVGDAHVTAQRVINRFVYAAGM
ncbi:hypothetical protein [Streptomyces sp. NPDC001068]|uniref:hypothetical protein n=1 Tax=Streptomyces sp. NPDC001068 TaxID=3364544 RepID=UPI0036BF0408